MEVKDIVKWSACQKCRMDVVEVETKESRAADVVHLDTRRKDCRTILSGQPATRSGPSGAKSLVQVHRVGCAVQLPKTPPLEPTGDGQVLELKSGGTIKTIHASVCEISHLKDKLPLVGTKLMGIAIAIGGNCNCHCYPKNWWEERRNVA